jgi:hypothetical protein
MVMDEGRKRTLLLAACILAARELAGWDGRPSPAVDSRIATAIAAAERIMRKIDGLWPTPAAGSTQAIPRPRHDASGTKCPQGPSNPIR